MLWPHAAGNVKVIIGVTAFENNTIAPATTSSFLMPEEVHVFTINKGSVGLDSQSNTTEPLEV